ncbi:hypothetical protein KR018_007537 [Drosophila ironensis]|nr:hypothetical protein KR018_007537 [Drosophila ironensis]
MPKGKGKAAKRATTRLTTKASIRASRLLPQGPPPPPPFNRSIPQYSFDLIVTRLQVNGVEFTDPRKLEVKVVFGGNDLALTASRTNVSAFKPNASLNFQSEPANLSKDLEENGMTFDVVYDYVTVGRGKVEMPKELTGDVGWDMEAFNYTTTCRLEDPIKPEVTVGSLEFLCKLFIKCSDYARAGETCANLDRNINPNDIVFVIGKPRNTTNDCDACRGVLEADSRRKKKENDYCLSTDPRCGY